MGDLVEVLSLSLVLAGLMTVHVYLLLGLSFRGQTRKALAALVFPPLGPFWAWKAHMRARTLAWVSLFVLYALLLTWILVRG